MNGTCFVAHSVGSEGTIGVDKNRGMYMGKNLAEVWFLEGVSGGFFTRRHLSLGRSGW